MTPLPTANPTLALRRAAFRSVPEMLDYAARGDTGVTFYSARGEPLSALPWREIRERAHVVARKLIGAGFAMGDRLLITADTWVGFFDAFFGAQYAGLLPVPVSIPVGIGGKEAYLEQLRRQFAASGAVAAVGLDELAGFLADAAKEFPAVRLQGGMGAIESLPEKPVDLRPLGADDTCYIQFSSGSTRQPHGVQITQAALMANLQGITGPGGLDVVEGDRATSWLPLYHDMGLIGFLFSPLSAQLSIDYLTPRDFARRPMQWLNLISKNRGTISYSPSFGYDLAVRRGAMQVPADLDLSSWRHAGIGGDMVRADVLDRFAQTFESKGFRPSAFIPSYGMAEVCLAITFCPGGSGMRTDTVDRTALAEAQRAEPAANPSDSHRARRFVVCGGVLPGHRLEVRDEGRVLGDRAVGRIFVKGPSIMPGYFQEPEASREVLSDGWLDTGDLGYTLNGEIVVTGRAKDLIIVNGRNVWPQDIEWAIEAQKVVKSGDAAAFSIDTADGERVVVAVLARVAGDEAKAALARDVAGAVREAVAVDCDVVLVPPTMGLPTTSSGKLSRSRTKANYLAGRYAPKPAAA
ncbi:MAG: fatty acyl-AMP ligase [Reyranella sp.]|uniref:fatty acyl-AMP ligase n=1 Tax=Reyranella sp. TaxID=1929291 RepID=UPI001AC0E2A1|nr:fatty acyl-AMP ligase [Reyranella sp.]MBN9089853.1 fatty acyl-AMP ligase [Reyranella sp.]